MLRSREQMRDYKRISLNWKSHRRSDQQREQKRNFGIVIDWERNDEETKIYGMDAEVFLMPATFTKLQKEKEN